jgi:hypothetical protein
MDTLDKTRLSENMKIWITYTYEDRYLADKIGSYLLKAGFDVLNIEKEIRPGDNIVGAISDAISAADLILVIVSKNSDERQWFSNEIALTISEIRKDSNKRVIPILIDKSAKIPPFIDQFQFLDLTDRERFSYQMQKLVQTITSGKVKAPIDNLLGVITEVTTSRTKLLELEKIMYEKERLTKQKLVLTTFLTTILSSALAFFSLFTGAGRLFKMDPHFNYSLVIALFGGLIASLVTLVLYQLTKK